MFEILKANILRKSSFLIIIVCFLLPIPKSHTKESFKIKPNKKNTTNIYITKSIDNNIKSEYLLGVGDNLLIEFKGLDIYTGLYGINQEGYIYFPELNNFYAKGMSINELRSNLSERYKEFIINPQINIKVINYRPISIYLSGEVKKSGLYQLAYTPLQNTFSEGSRNTIEQQNYISPKLFDALVNAEGLTNFADISKIQIIRKNSESQGGGEIKATINLLTLITEGDQSQNIRLFDGDYIFVPRSEKVIKEQILAINKSNINPSRITVYITGNVVKAGESELAKGSSLIQAIASTGGKKILTGNVEFIRFNTNGTKQKSVFRFDENAKIGSKRNPILMDGDIINIKRTFLGKTAEVLGEISSPVLSGYGIYSIFSN